MSLYAKLQQRAAEGRPVRIGLIGAGKFGSMYLAQVPRTPGVHLAGIADLAPDAARANLARVGWTAERSQAKSLDEAIRSGATHISEDWATLVRHPGIDVIVECTGHPIAAVDHCLAAFAHGKHVVNVTVEADAFCGALLARKAAEAGVVYSLAFGDQPALICDLVDWARTCGFPVVAAGRGHKWLPHYCESTPDTVWGNYGLTPEQARRGGLNPKMFNSFIDGSKPSIESTAVSNATGLFVPSNGLQYPPASIADIPFVTRPISEGGVLEKKGMVEVISSLEANGRVIPYDIRMGVWVTVEAETDYIKNCFEEYNAHTDPSGRYFTLYKRWHLIGLEVGVSVASVALRGEATGVATGAERSNVNAGIHGVLVQAEAVAEDGTSGKRRAGIDRDDPHPAVRCTRGGDQSVGEGALSGARRPRDADHPRGAGTDAAPCGHPRHQGIRAASAGFHPADEPSQRGTIPGESK